MNRFDYLEVRGSHKDVGKAIGSRFKEVIQKQVSRRRKRIANYVEFLKRSEPYYKAAKEYFPKLVEELESTAYAAGVGVEDYFSINNREVINSDHCTVAVSFGKNGAIVGHNEDWESASSDALYFLKATIGDTTFLGLQYKVAMAGVAATMNSWGLVQCINDLYQNTQIGVPKNFLARAVLEARTLNEAENLLRKTKRASGFNHVLVQGKEVRNIEIAGDVLAVEKVINKPYVHTNHYLSPEMKFLEKFHTKSSEARYERAKEIIKPSMRREEMEMLLSDTEDEKFPICREDATLGSIVFLPEEKKVYACYGHPCAGEFIEYE